MKIVAFTDDKIVRSELGVSLVGSKQGSKPFIEFRPLWDPLKGPTELAGFDLMFLDLHFSKKKPDGQIKALREVAPHTPLILLVNEGDEDFAVRMLRGGGKYRGADDYIEKTKLSSELLRRVLRYGNERRRMQSNYREAVSRAQENAAVRSAFLANMSHEIRTPLNLIIGTADLLGETELSAQQKRLLGTFTKAGNHLLTLLNNVLDISHIEMAGLHCREEIFDPNDVFFDVCDMATALCRAKKISFDYLLGPDIACACMGDRVRVRQVLLNLLNNAVKFTEKGQIQLRMEAVQTTNKQVTIRILVKDNGIGISKPELKKVFDYFYQSDTGLKRKFGGAGLGLSVVKGIVEHYKGGVRLDSKPGVGTEVTATLRFDLMPAPKITDKKPLHEQNILLMTHGQLEGQSLFHQFRRAGAQTHWVSSNKMFCEELKSGKNYDYIIVDLLGKSHSALQLIAGLDGSVQRQKIVLLMPPLHRRDDIEIARSLGVENFIYKPFTTNKFMDVVANRAEIAADTAAAPNILAPKAELPNLDVLVVDDDADNRDLVAAYMRQTGHRVCFASTGLEAIELARQREFHVVLLDIEMPGMNGYETAKLMRRLASCQETRILGLSANAFMENILEAKRSGFSGYITKPVKKEKLIASILECTAKADFYLAEIA